MGTSRSILVVDDDERVLFVLREALARLGSRYKVVAAGSGREGLAKAQKTHFDLVLADWHMPDIDGVALTEAIQALYPDTRFLWITAYDAYEVRQEASRLGVLRCLDKPMAIEEIRRAVLDALQGQRNHALAKVRNGPQKSGGHSLARLEDVHFWN
jgi:CheY-like chemotaxis protein